MKRLVVSESMRLVREDTGAHRRAEDVVVAPHLFEQLRRFDIQGAPSEDKRVFSWGEGFAKPRHWVGLIRLPGAVVEILPSEAALASLHAPADDDDVDVAEPDRQQQLDEVRRNLVYMLAFGGKIPVTSRSAERLGSRRTPLTETLAALFAERLRHELTRGLERGYREFEENLRHFKGKLALSQHLGRNVVNKERIYCRYDDYVADTPMNRIFKATCWTLLEAAKTAATREALEVCIVLLEDVAEVPIHESDFVGINFNRQNERFEDIFRFAELLLRSRASTTQPGASRTFSLLFDMHEVFECFVGAFLQKHVAPRYKGMRVYTQALRHGRYLMETEGRGVLRLEPDVLLVHDEANLVLDLSWAVRNPNVKHTVTDADLYRHFAYMRRYGVPQTLLLIPAQHGSTEQIYDILGNDEMPSGERIIIRPVDLRRTLQNEAQRQDLANELQALLTEYTTTTATTQQQSK